MKIAPATGHAARQDTTDRSNGHLRLARVLGAISALAVYASLVRQVFVDPLDPLTQVLSVALILLPFLGALAASRLPDHLDTERRRRALILLQTLPLFFLQSQSFGIVLSGALVLVLGNLLVHAGNRVILLALLAFAPTAALLEMARMPGEFWLVALPINLVCALIGWMLYSANEHATWLARRLSARLPRPPLGATTGRTLLSGIAIGFCVFALAPFLYLPLLSLPQPFVGNKGRTMPSPPQTHPEREGEQGASGKEAEVAFEGSFPSELDFAGGVTRLADEKVLEIYPEPARYLGPLYMRGMVLDTITTSGASFRGSTSPPEHTDKGDGKPDGWTCFDRGTDDHELRVRLHPIAIGPSFASVLFSPQPVHAVGLSRVQYDPDGLLLHPVRTPEGKWLEYRVRFATQTTPEHFADPGSLPARYLQLPDEPAAMRWLRTYSHEIIGTADTHLDEIEAVVAHFNTGFEYSLRQSDLPGLQGVLEFLDAKRGYCSYFAVASALILRTKGIPARIATGFLAQEWNEDEQRYDVTTRDGHAWLEAYVTGRWIAFEPTPSRQRERALAAAAAAEEDSLLALAGSLLNNLSSWLASGDEFYLRMFWLEFQLLLALLWNSLFFRLSVLSIVLVIVTRSALRSRYDTPRKSKTRHQSLGETGLQRQLLLVLRILGHEKHKAQTLREFLAKVRSSDPARFSPLVEIGEELYRSRWGQHPIEKNRRGAALRYLISLRQAK